MAWLLTRARHSNNRPRRQRTLTANFRPLVERLEDRTLLSNVLPPGSLHAAIAAGGRAPTDGKAPVQASPQLFTISGTVYKDSTGNGLSSDDGTMKGAVV